MNFQSKYMLFSLALHSGVIGAAVALSSSFANVSKPLVLDFSVADSAPTAQKKEQPLKNLRQEIQSPKSRLDRETVPEKPRTEKILAAAPPPPAPITEAAGPVAITAPVRQAASMPQQQAPKSSGSPIAEQRSAVSGVAAANNAEQMANRYLKQHFEYIKELIQKNLVYPAVARRMGLTGKVVVSFVILEDGHVAQERILTGSGHSVLDNNVIETIRMVEPFPKPPVKAELRIPVFYGTN